jgi:GDP-L-fucose synthase
MDNYSEQSHINIGTGLEISIKEFAEVVRDVVGINVDLRFDARKPDGTPRKVMDVSRINNLGWKAKTSLKDGLKVVYDWYRQTHT